MIPFIFVKPDVRLKSNEHINFFKCSDCKKNMAHVSTLSTGYATDVDGNKICFDCMGKRDAKELSELKVGGKIAQYWNGKEIVNWPSTLRIKPYYVTTGRHNWAGKREDIYFNFSGHRYRATNYGDNSQIAHIKRLKG